MTKEEIEKVPEDPIVKHSLVDLCKSIGGMIPNGQRIYQVTGIGGEARYVLSNSPGQAAMTVVDVERLSDKEINQAAFQALADMAKGKK